MKLFRFLFYAIVTCEEALPRDRHMHHVLWGESVVFECQRFFAQDDIVAISFSPDTRFLPPLERTKYPVPLCLSNHPR
jgi:hypothetical protein